MSKGVAWRYYKHAMIPVVPPHEKVDLSELENGALWKKNPKALLARWTTDFDCGYETNWWYLIKDEPFDINQIKAKRRYDINKGKRLFRVSRINPEQFIEEIYLTQVAAYEKYPAKYRPVADKEKVKERACCNWTKSNVWFYAAFFCDTGEFAGCALYTDAGKYLDFNAQWVKPKYEKHQINAALIEYVLEQWRIPLTNGYYICDGERNILHETAFQDYLERYFGFRKAYCKLFVRYRPGVGWVIRCLYPFRKLLKKLGDISIVHKLNAVLCMEVYTKDRIVTNE